MQNRNPMNFKKDSPEAAGVSAARLAVATDYLRKVVSLGALPLAEVIVVRGTKIVLHDRHVNPKIATEGYGITDDTIFEVASVTKPLCGAVVMCLVEKGNLSLDIPVAEYIPEFGKAGKGPMFGADGDGDSSYAPPFGGKPFGKGGKGFGKGKR